LNSRNSIGCLCDSTGCFYQQNTKTTKSSYKRVKGEKESHKLFYTGSLLHQELHPVPRNLWVSTKLLKTTFQTQTTKEVILILSRTHTSFGTPQIRTPSDSVNTSTYRITNEKEIGLITPGTNKIKVHS